MIKNNSRRLAQRRRQEERQRFAVKREALLNLLSEGDPELRAHYEDFSYPELVAIRHTTRQRAFPQGKETA